MLPAILRVAVAIAIAAPAAVGAQTVTRRGFADAALQLFPERAPADPTRAVAGLLVREEVFLAPARGIQFGAGLDFRLSSHDQVETRWRPDWSDRGTRRPLLAVRRLTATWARGPLTVDGGKQFIRWGKTDIVTPTDRFAPRDFMNVIDTEFLAVTGVRAAAELGADTVEVAWVPRFTPSRIPLLGQRWSGLPAVTLLPVIEAGADLPDGHQAGVRWSRVGTLEYSVSFFSGFNHLPAIAATVSSSPPALQVRRRYPSLRTWGADAAVPTRWATIKGELAYFTSRDQEADEYVLYVVQAERQTGEWLLVGGYAGEAVTRSRGGVTFSPDRGLSRAFVARASYTLGPTRSAAFEGAVRQHGGGLYVRGEYTQSHGRHWRTTAAAIVIAGDDDDFLGRYRRNSHAALTLRYSF